jgi:hypothetical protein
LVEQRLDGKVTAMVVAQQVKSPHAKPLAPPLSPAEKAVETVTLSRVQFDEMNSMIEDLLAEQKPTRTGRDWPADQKAKGP